MIYIKHRDHDGFVYACTNDRSRRWRSGMEGVKESDASQDWLDLCADCLRTGTWVEITQELAFHLFPNLKEALRSHLAACKADIPQTIGEVW